MTDEKKRPQEVPKKRRRSYGGGTLLIATTATAFIIALFTGVIAYGVQSVTGGKGEKVEEGVVIDGVREFKILAPQWYFEPVMIQVNPGDTVRFNCHGLKYLGYHARTPANVVAKAFGSEPADLSLIAKARGRGDKGAGYIYALLTSFNDTVEKNSVFPNIAMPPPIPKTDLQLEQKAKDISAFLLYAAEPTAAERKRLGRYVLGYMVILTVLLYALNKKTWKDIKKKKGKGS